MRSYAEIAEHVQPKSLDGLLADLGISSMQLQDAGRGFSFQAEGPLDMRMDPQAELTADQVVNRMSERELADVIYEFGEERRSRRIARAICRARPIRTTAHLAQVISVAARPMNPLNRRIHPATRTFQALRIFVNHELDDLKELLAALPPCLHRGQAGGHQLPFVGRPDRERRAARWRERREIRTAHEEAGDGEGKKKSIAIHAAAARSYARPRGRMDRNFRMK